MDPSEPPVRAPMAGPSKVLGNQAKKQEEVTRHGTQRMKFVPTLPPRRPKLNTEAKQEEPPPQKPTERGRGRGGEPGRGRGRGGPPQPRPEIQMVASGPFAMGPAMAGSSSHKRAFRSNPTPVMPPAPGPSTPTLSNTGPPVLTREKEKDKFTLKQEDEEIEVYSDPDEGVQIIDMNAVKAMDWMAPESLRKERHDTGKLPKKKEMEALKRETKGKAKEQEETEVDVIEAEVQKNLANALDLSESEEEEEIEDLIEHFAQQVQDEDVLTRPEKLYFFQFPSPFPTFTKATEGDVMDLDTVVDDKPVLTSSQADVSDKGKRVSFVDGVKPPGPNGSTSEAPTEVPGKPKKIAGVIGHLEVHQSGMIKMRLNNGMILDVAAATQPSFLQHAIYLDTEAKKMHVLGEVNRRFVVSPDVDRLLVEAEIAETARRIKAENSGTPMGTT